MRRRRTWPPACSRWSSTSATRSAQVDAFCDALQLFKLGYSWGGPISLVVPYDIASMRSAGCSWPHKGMLVRFSVGLEAVEDLQADLEQALARWLSAALLARLYRVHWRHRLTERNAVATPNYGYEKRQKELAKKRKKEDKLKAKADRKPVCRGDGERQKADEPAQAEPPRPERLSPASHQFPRQLAPSPRGDAVGRRDRRRLREAA